MDINANPFASPAVVDDGYEAAVIAEKGTGDWNEKWDRIILVGFVLTWVFGPILSFINIESILFSGGILVGLGSVFFAREAMLRRRGSRTWVLAQTIAVVNVVVPIAILATIAINEWSPPEATEAGIPFYISMIAPMVIALCVWAHFRIPREPEFQT